MATYTNRSKRFFKIKQRDGLYREFHFHDTHAAHGYLKQPRADGYEPIVGLPANAILQIAVNNDELPFNPAHGVKSCGRRAA